MTVIFTLRSGDAGYQDVPDLRCESSGYWWTKKTEARRFLDPLDPLSTVLPLFWMEGTGAPVSSDQAGCRAAAKHLPDEEPDLFGRDASGHHLLETYPRATEYLQNFYTKR